MQRITTTFRPSTRNSHMVHFKTFIAFAVYMNFDIEFSLPNILAFLECLVHNKISPKVVANYISFLKTVAKLFFIPSGDLITPLFHFIYGQLLGTFLTLLHLVAFSTSRFFSPSLRTVSFYRIPSYSEQSFWWHFLDSLGCPT